MASSFLSLSCRVQPSILIALSLPWNIIGRSREDRHEGLVVPDLPSSMLSPSASKNHRRKKLTERSGYPPGGIRMECAVFPVFPHWKAAPASSVSYRLLDTFRFSLDALTYDPAPIVRWNCKKDKFISVKGNRWKSCLAIREFPV